jgi:hypothetical protein
VRRTGLLLGALLVLAVAAQAAAAEISRDEYVERVEPICKVNSEANERILSGVRKRVQEGKLGVAAGQFMKAAQALKKTRTQILAVPKPAADAAKLTKWLGYVKTEVSILEGISRKLKAGDKVGAQKESVALIDNANRTNAEVISFEFQYCWFEPSKYT